MHAPSLARCATLLALAAGAVGQIPLSTYQSAFSLPNATRGYYFQAPGAFIVTHVQVPDEQNAGMQVVALYKMNAAPPQYSASVPVTPVFYAAVNHANVIPVVPPVIYQQGDWFGVLGAAGAPNATLHNSYGAGNFPSRVLGMPVTLLRLLMQSNIGNSAGVGSVSAEGTFQIARVRVFVAGQGEAMTYGTGAGGNALLVSDPFPPSIAQTAEFSVRPGSASNLGGVLLVSGGQGNVNTPFGQLLVSLPILATVPIPGPIPAAGVPISLMLANDPSMLGAVVCFQAGVAAASTVSLTNGLQWRVGL